MLLADYTYSCFKKLCGLLIFDIYTAVECTARTYLLTYCVMSTHYITGHTDVT